jgi:hypothetical protein
VDWILHIGTQKTGSKDIQSFLANHIFSASEHGICFPVSGRENIWHQPIFHELLIGKTQQLEMAIKEGIASSADVGVLSYEALYLLTSPKIELLFHILGDAKVVLFIRRQDQLVNSMYNQLIKAHRVNFEYIKNFESRIENYNPDFDHMLTIKRWGEVCGFDHVIPIIYDKNTSSIEKFFFHVGIHNISLDSGQQNDNLNPALNFEALKILRLIKRLNKNDEDLPRLVNVAHHVLRDSFVDTYSGGDQYLLSMSQRKAIYEHYHDSNTALNRMYFPDKDELFPPLESDQINIPDYAMNTKLVHMIFHEAKISFSERDWEV